MRWKICIIGKPALAFAKSGSDEYMKRLRRSAKVELVTFREAGQSTNGQNLLRASEGSVRIVMDERGDVVSTQDWVKKINSWEQTGSVKTVSILIGGADGHGEDVRQAADHVWSLSGLTLQHELALVVLLEGLYRCYTIKQGAPYHR